MGYLDEQLITYLGNKHLLLSMINQGLQEIEKEIKIKTAIDLFSGSGVFKSKGYDVIANDLENYSYIINQCYLSNIIDFDSFYWKEIANKIKLYPKVYNGAISSLYAPKETDNIQAGERAFYTKENAVLIDTYRTAIEEVCPKNYQKFF